VVAHCIPEADPYARLAAVYDEIVADHCHRRWAAYLNELWRSDPTGVRSVLDLCCGTGLMSAEMAALGYRVTGVDRSAAMLARARDLLGPDVVLAQQTLPDVTIPGVFDAAVSTFDGFNYLTASELGATLSAVSRRLRRNGWLIFDLHTDAMMNFTLDHPVVDGEADGMHFEITSIVEVSSRACTTRITITGNDDRAGFSEEHRQYFLSNSDVRHALTSASFAVLAVTDEYTHDPVDRSSLRATWVARYVPGQ
jgi:SAM-dependent methyltransferase